MGRRAATSWPRVFLRETEVKECMSLFFWSMVRITYTFASGPIARQTEGVSVLSGVGPARKWTRSPTGKRCQWLDH